MKASLALTLCALTISSTALCMHEPTHEKWGDRAERLEREQKVSETTHTTRRDYGNKETRVWRPRTSAQPSTQVTAEQRSLRVEPDRKTNVTKTHFYSADRTPQAPTPTKAELQADAETASKIAILFKLLPDMIEGNKAQVEQTQQMLALFERMFLGMDQKIRDLQVAESQRFMQYQAEANAKIIALQEQLCTQQQETHTAVVESQAQIAYLTRENLELKRENVDLLKLNVEFRKLTKENYGKIQKTLAKLDEKTHGKSTTL